MFTDEILELFFRDEEVRKVPIGCQSTVLHAIERILTENNYQITKKE